MCGIIGYYSLDNKSDEIKRNFDIAFKNLKTRGPDQSGKYFGKKILLGNTRLSIVSKKKIHLPFKKHNCLISFNGEIFNHKELRNELVVKGYLFTTDTDTEVILSAYNCYGKNFAKKLRGFFAISIYDISLDKVILVRDRFGNKPLYYSLKNNKLIFSSTQSSLIKSSLVEFVPNDSKFNDFIVFGDATSLESTLHKNIFNLAPATILIFDGKNLKKEEYYKIENELLQNFTFSSKSEIEYRNLLTKSLEETLCLWCSDYKDNLSVLLSGGLDSSVISVLASRTNEIKNTFTLNFTDQKSINEIKQARYLSNKIKAINKDIKISSKNIFNNLFKIYSDFDEPVPSSGLLMYKIMQEIYQKNSTKVLLTGDGSDEIFGGYQRHQIIHKKFLKSKKIEDIALGLNYLTINRFKKFLGIHNYVIPKNRINFLKKIENFDPLSIIFLNDLKFYLPQFLKSNDRIAMEFSTELRSPFTDHALIQTVFNIPNKFKIKKNIQKYILHKAFNKIFEEKKIEKKKFFQVPYVTSEFKHGVLKNIFLDLLNNSKISRFYDINGLKKLLGDHSIKNDHSNTLFRFLTLELFLRSKI